MFTGQGSQVPGMGHDFFGTFNGAKKVMTDAIDGLGLPEIRDIMFDENRVDELNKTINTQPAIMINGMMIFQSIIEKFPDFMSKIKVIAGHSVGEYNGLCAAGFFDVKAGVDLLKFRANAMESACESGAGGMVALLGANNEQAQNLINDGNLKGMKCEIANDNGAEQIVLSGEIEAIDLIPGLIANYGIKKAIKLKVSGPFHSSMMIKAQENMKQKLQNITFNSASSSIPVIANYNLDKYSIDNIKDLLANQITAPVRWRETMLKVYHEMGVRCFVEIGPSPTLTNLAKKTFIGFDDMKYLSISKVEDLEGLADL